MAIERPAVTEEDADNSNMVERLRGSMPRHVPGRAGTATEVPLTRAESAIRPASQVNDGECDDEMAEININIISDLDMAELDAQQL